MNWVDYLIIGVIVFSSLVSVLRGFVRELLSLIGWVGAICIAKVAMEPASELFVGHVTTPSVRLGLAFAVVFIGALFMVGLLNFLLGRLIAGTGLRGTDRILGVVFGAARGALIIALGVLLAGLTPLPDDPWWHASLLLPRFQEFALWIRAYLPAELASSIGY